MSFFDALAMIALWIRQAEEALLKEVTVRCQTRLRCETCFVLSVSLFLVPKGERNVLDPMCV